MLSSPHVDTVTFLQAGDVVGAKTHSSAGVVPYASGSGPFRVVSGAVGNLEEAAQAILRCPFNAFLVRGRAAGEQIPYRRSRPRPGEPATLEAQAHRLLPVDVDADDGRDGTQIRENAEVWREFLPPAFRAAQCFVQATSSAGVKPGSRLRLWFWCARPVADHEAKAWLKDCGVDTRIYSPAQPIYCAAPRFDGIPDPCPVRSCWLDGAAEVQVPERFDAPAPLSPSFRALLAAATNVATPGTTGTRNNTLTSLAGTMRKRGMTPGAIAAGLHAQNETFPEPLPPEEVDAIARSVGNYEPETVAPPRSGKAAEKAARKATKVLQDDPGLLPRQASVLAGHVREGGITEAQAVAALERGLATSASTVTRDELSRMLSTAPVVQPTVESWASAMQLNDDGNPVPSPANLQILLEQHPEFTLWHDSRAREDQWERCPWREPGAVSPHDDFALRAWVSRHLGWHRIPADPLAAIAEVAAHRPWDPWHGFLESLEWDGQPRLDMLGPEILQSPDAAPYRRTLSWWLLSAVARTYRPGCQVDHVIVLEGEQDRGKTTFLRTLAMDDRFFTRLVSGADLSSPRTVGKIHGPAIVELAELAALRGKEVESIKAFLDERTDKVQWLYARKPVTIQRTCVFAATTNEDTYLRDPTGNRRFWPIPVGVVQLERLVEIREQIWAEATHRYKSGEAWWPTREESIALGLAGIQAERQEEEPVHDTVLRVLAKIYTPGRCALTGTETRTDMIDAAGRLVRATILDVCERAGLTSRDTKAVARTLRHLGWRPSRTRGTRVWIAPDARSRGVWLGDKTPN